MSDLQHHSQSGETSSSDEAASVEMTAIAYALDEWYTQLGRQFGPLSRPQRRMLRLLSESSMVRVGDLGEQLGLTTAGATRMLDKLEALGYATRSRTSQHDQRQVYVALTPTGAAALREADDIFLQRVQASLSKLRPAERVQLAHLLQTLHTR